MKLQKQTGYPKCPVLPHGGARRDSARNNEKTNWGKAGQYPDRLIGIKESPFTTLYKMFWHLTMAML